MDVLLSTAHVLAWSIYVGGALCMELVLRHAQQFMPPSQVAVVCQNAGYRYRWFSAVALAVLLITGFGLAGSPLPLLPSSRGLVLWMLLWLWALQVVALALLSFFLHPQMHNRADATMTPEQLEQERQRIGVAIRRMDRLLRMELFLALTAVVLGSMLHALPQPGS